MATKAALFSALLYPGWGQIYLKKYKRGIAFILPVTAAIISIVWSIIQMAITIIKAAPLKKGTVDFSVVIKVTGDAIKAINLKIFFFMLAIIILLWIYSIFDAYILGKKMMNEITTSVDQHLPSPPA
jgi:TM2 domain-containing membrane protein YozV